MEVIGPSTYHDRWKALDMQCCAKLAPDWRLEENPLFHRLFALGKEHTGLSVSEAKKLYDELSVICESSGAAEPLIKALARHNKDHKITKAIVFGLSVAGQNLLRCTPESRSHWMWMDMTVRHMVQLITFTGTIAFLCANFGYSRGDIQGYAQDPGLTPEDEEFLLTLGIQAVEAPYGETLVDAETFVYGPFVHKAVPLNLWVRCARHQPCLHLGHDFKGVLKMITIERIYPNLDADRRRELEARLLEYKRSIVELDLLKLAFNCHKLCTYDSIQFKKEVTSISDVNVQCTKNCGLVANTITDREHGPEVDPENYHIVNIEGWRAQFVAHF